MKKEYIRPETEVMELRTSGMLCLLSGEIDGDATEDAQSPGLSDDWDATDWEFDE